MRTLLRAGAALVVLAAILSPTSGAVSAAPVADTDTEYAVCGRVFSDPHAYWPLAVQAPERSPFAKGNAVCAATDFLSYEEMVSGVEYLEGLFPDFVQFYNLERDFGDGSDCATAIGNEDLCSAGLPRQGVPAERVRSDLYMIRVTDERVADEGKRFFVFPLGIHGIERAGVEAGVRAAEDLATWAYCEAVAEGSLPSNGLTNCAQEGAIPHPLLETQPGSSVTAGDALARSAVYFVFANPDGWRRGDPDNLVRFYQRYNGNGVDMNRDWPTIGFTFPPYTPWSEPETRGFGQVLKGIRDTWDGGIDLHGQLIDRAFSFTLLGASQRDFAKNQRILQTVKGAWEDAEKRFEWADAYIKPNDAPADDPRMYGVQWGTVWDTINYTVTGSLGDWIDSPLGLGADGIDNEMSFSHIINCGTGSCYLADFEQLHVDGNKSLIYAMVNFTLLPEDDRFAAPGKVGYILSSRRLSNEGSGESSDPTEGLPPQDPILDVQLDATNNFTFHFDIRGPEDGVFNGGVEGKATPMNVGGISAQSITHLVIERFKPTEETPQEDAGCGEAGDQWEEVNRYYNQSSIYLQSGQAVHANDPSPGAWRICMTGELEEQLAASGGFVDLDVTFSGQRAWEDPGQLPYDVSNMEFFGELAPYMEPGQLEAVDADDVLTGAVDLDRFTSLVVADDAFPGFSEPAPTGPAQDGVTFDNPGTPTVPCAGDEDAPATCRTDHEFDVDAAFNNQQMVARLTGQVGDFDMFVQRQSPSNPDQWFTVGAGQSGSLSSETVTILAPIPGHYRVRVVNWAGVKPPTRLAISFSNEYPWGEPPPNERTQEEVDAWGAALRDYVEGGGNLVLTDGGLLNLAFMGVLPRDRLVHFAVFAGYIGFTRDGETSTYDDPLARDVNQPGAAEGPQFRHQTYEPVPIGYSIGEAPSRPEITSPAWAVDQGAWEGIGGRTAGITIGGQTSLGELALGSGVVRIIGPLLPMPTDRFYHPFGLSSYALTYTGYQVLNNALQWERPVPDLTLTSEDISLSTKRVLGGDEVTITARIHNVGTGRARDVDVRFDINEEHLATRTIDLIPAGESRTTSATWNTKGLPNGEYTITVTADPGDAIAELDEGNNSARGPCSSGATRSGTARSSRHRRAVTPTTGRDRETPGTSPAAATATAPSPPARPDRGRRTRWPWRRGRPTACRWTPPGRAGASWSSSSPPPGRSCPPSPRCCP